MTPVHGIVVEERDLVIGTHGRGFYVLDNIGVLRQATPELTTNNLFVFETFNPLRGRDRNVTFDYYLGKDADEVKIEFLDAQGSVLRSFTGTPKPRRAPGLPEGVDAETAAFFGMTPARVGVAKGMNRFTWDMRYEGATVFPGMIMWAAQPQRGPAAPPGKYTVRITANGETKTRDFTLGVDPRLAADGITEAYLQEQFKLSQQVRDQVTAANMAVIQIRGIREQINQRLEKVGPRRKAEIQKLADGVLKPLAAVEEEVYQVKNQSGQDPLNYPIKLNNKIAALMGVIESADHRPTEQTYEVFDELSKALERGAAEEGRDAQDRPAAPERRVPAREARAGESGREGAAADAAAASAVGPASSALRLRTSGHAAALRYNCGMRVARRFLVSGRVQGVGFRFFAADAARREGLSGSVRNLDDGRVEVAAEGRSRIGDPLRAGAAAGPVAVPAWNTYWWKTPSRSPGPDSSSKTRRPHVESPEPLWIT